MKKLLCLFVFPALFAATASATNYYVSSITGNDANNGTSTATAWKTLAKVNSTNSQFVAGDTIFFKSGDIFYGFLQINNRHGNATASIVYTSYGSGSLPVFRASQKITGWSQQNGNIWKADANKLSRMVWNGSANVPFYYRTPSLFISNAPQRLGREPNYDAQNGGYRTIATHTIDNKSITESAALPYPANHFAGADVAIRSNRDYFKYEKVLSHSGSTVNITATHAVEAINTIRDGFGYIFQNHINTLNQNGEWYHDTTASKLYLYSATDPNILDIEMPLHPNTLVINNSSYVKIIGLRLENASYVTLAGQNDSYITIDGCEVFNNAEYGSQFYGVSHSNFTNNTIKQSINVGLRWELIEGTVFSGNIISGAGLWPGMGADGYIGHTGFRVYTKGSGNPAPSIAENNLIDSIGYHGFSYGGENFTIRRNVIRKFCLVKDDGGGIYTANNNNPTKIYENFVHDAPGAPLGAPAGSEVKAAGIYPDNHTTQKEIYRNTIYNVATWGILSNLSGNNNFYENTIFNCGSGIVLNTYGNNFGPGGSTATATHNTMIKNILFPAASHQFCAEYKNPHNPSDLTTNLGTLDSNYYCQPLVNGNEIQVKGTTVNNFTLEQFKTQYPAYEANGKGAPVKLKPEDDVRNFLRLETNPTGIITSVNLGSEQYVDATGVVFTGTVQLPPYASLALIKDTRKDTVATTPPAQETSAYRLFPNPVMNNNIDLYLNLAEKQSISVCIIAPNGQVVYTKNFNMLQAGTHTVTLHDIKFLSSGLYFIQLKIGSTTKTEKILYIR